MKTFLLIVLILLNCFSSLAQDLTPEQDSAVKATARALTLWQQQRFVEAIPDLEVAMKALPDQPRLRFMYGWCLVAKSKRVKDVNEAKQLSARALEELKKAKEMGLEDEANDALIKILTGEPLGGKPIYSENPEAEKTMQQAESLFAQSKYDEAVKLFAKVLELDPKLYQAAT